jgi:hypothetical protein
MGRQLSAVQTFASLLKLVQPQAIGALPDDKVAALIRSEQRYGIQSIVVRPAARVVAELEHLCMHPRELTSKRLSGGS